MRNDNVDATISSRAKQIPVDVAIHGAVVLTVDGLYRRSRQSASGLDPETVRTLRTDIDRTLGAGENTNTQRSSGIPNIKT